MRTKKTDLVFLMLLDNFRKSYRELNNFFIEDQKDDYTHLAPSLYPFEQSFDDYMNGIHNWVNGCMKALRKPKTLDNYPTLETMSDVEEWFLLLLKSGIAFHPDSDFTEFTNISAVDGENLNAYMTDCHSLCQQQDIDIYEIAVNAWDKFIIPDTPVMGSFDKDGNNI